MDERRIVGGQGWRRGGKSGWEPAAHHHPVSLSRLLLALSLFLSAPVAAQPEWGRAETDFAEAYALFDARLFGEAERAFAGFRATYPDDPRTPDALFYGGEAALAAGDDATAERLLTTFRTRYPTHPLAPAPASPSASTTSLPSSTTGRSARSARPSPKSNRPRTPRERSS